MARDRTTDRLVRTVKVRTTDRLDRLDRTVKPARLVKLVKLVKVKLVKVKLVKLVRLVRVAVEVDARVAREVTRLRLLPASLLEMLLLPLVLLPLPLLLLFPTPPLEPVVPLLPTLWEALLLPRSASLATPTDLLKSRATLSPPRLLLPREPVTFRTTSALML
jgi:hypothetical protein